MKFSQNILETYMNLLHIKFSKIFLQIKSSENTKIYIFPWSKVKERVINPC